LPRIDKIKECLQSVADTNCGIFAGVGHGNLL
jgi:hypothetical protein